MYLTLITLIFILGCKGESAVEGQELQNPPTEVETVWFFLHSGARFGPLTKDQLLSKYQEGRLHPGLKAWTENSRNWETLKNIFPNTPQAGTLEAGENWTDIFRQVNRIPEPNNSDVNTQESQIYLNDAKDVLINARNLNGSYGPPPEIEEEKGFTQAASARKLARLLRLDIEDAVRKNDQTRALESMATLCSLSHQMYLVLPPVRPSMLNTVVDANEYFEISNLLSISAVLIMSDIIVNPEHSSLAEQLERSAIQNMTWSSPEMLDTYEQVNVSQDPKFAARTRMTRRLLSQ